MPLFLDEGEVATIPPDGVVALTATADGTVQKTTSDGTTEAIGGGGAASWLGTQLTRAQLVHESLVVPYEENLIIDPGLNSVNQQIAFGRVVTGSGTAAKQSVQGGVYRLDTGTTINSTTYITSPNNTGDFVSFNLAGGPFYMSFRARFLGTPNAAETKFIGAFTNTFASYCMIHISNGAFALIFIKPAQSQKNLPASTYVADYSAAHDYAIGFDGTTVQAYVDGVAIAGCSTTDLTSMPTVGLWLGAYCSTAAGGSSNSMDVDGWCLIVPSLA